MIIEFYGLPGSGKTTIARALEKKDPAKFVYLHTSPRKEIIKLVPLFFIHHIGITIFWLKELFFKCFKSHFFPLFRYKLHLLLITFVQYQKAKNYKNKVVLLDEGFLQRILSIYESRLTKDKIIHYFNHLIKADLIVFTKNSESEFSRFISSSHKDQSPRTKLGEEYLSQWMEITRSNYQMIKDLIKAKNVKFIEVKGEFGLDICLDMIIKEIEKLKKEKNI